MQPVKRKCFSLIFVMMLLACFLGMVITAHAAQVSIGWDTDSSSSTTGYKVYYGTASRTYTNSIDVGNTTSYTVPNLTAGTNYYFATTAYCASTESGYSNEIQYMPPVPPPPPAVPVASFTASPNTGTAPLTVQFTDTSTGSITSWAWNFGDGTTSTTQNPSHIYSQTGTYNATLTVSNASGSNTATATIAVTTAVTLPPSPPPSGSPPANSFLSYAEISVDSNWQTVTFARTFKNPVVVAKPLSYNDANQAVLRIRNVTGTGFDIRVGEWDYLDGVHLPERVAYLVMDAGDYTLANGTRIEAGTFTCSNFSSFSTFNFKQAFKKTPVLLVSVETYNGSNCKTNRMKSIGTKSFQFRLQEQLSYYPLSWNPPSETIGYIAWEPSSGTQDGWNFQIGLTSTSITDKFSTITFPTPFTSVPSFLADIQTANQVDNAAELRWQKKDQFGVQVKIEEETSASRVTTHKAEVVGYMTFAP
jgi:PKD repeat protein